MSHKVRCMPVMFIVCLHRYCSVGTEVLFQGQQWQWTTELDRKVTRRVQNYSNCSLLLAHVHTLFNTILADFGASFFMSTCLSCHQPLRYTHHLHQYILSVSPLMVQWWQDSPTEVHQSGCGLWLFSSLHCIDVTRVMDVPRLVSILPDIRTIVGIRWS